MGHNISNSLRENSHDFILDTDFDIDIIVTVAKEEEKVAAILYCFSRNEEGGYTVRTARQCATRYTPVGEKTTYKIMRILSYKYGLIQFDTKKRRWVPTPNMPKLESFEEAVSYVEKIGVTI